MLTTPPLMITRMLVALTLLALTGCAECDELQELDPDSGSPSPAADLGMDGDLASDQGDGGAGPTRDLDVESDADESDAGGSDSDSDADEGDAGRESGPSLSTVDEVRLGQVVPGTVGQRVIGVYNDGDEALRIDGVTLTLNESGAFTITRPDPSRPDDLEADLEGWPALLAPGEGFPLRVSVRPLLSVPLAAEILIESDAGDSPAHRIAVDANGETPCVRLKNLATGRGGELKVDFGQVLVGAEVERAVLVENCSLSEALTLSDLNVLGPAGFSLSQPSGSSVTVEPLGGAELLIAFKPQTVGLKTGTLSFESNDPSQPTFEVALRGEGTTEACPTAVAEARVSGGGLYTGLLTTIPLKNVELRARDAASPNGAIVAYDWAFVSRPIGSTSRLTPSSAVANPMLFLDVAGIYELELRVTDEANAMSCAPSRVTIEARPDEDLSIELTWETPSDADQNDDFGTDLDLHYKRAGGDWGDRLYDIFWQNTTSDWGVINDPSDDPSLDIDDTDGKGPENINHDNPPTGLYRIGVYYYDDNGFGASYATVRAYSSGVLIYEGRDKYMQSETFFWDVIEINEAGQVVVTQGFP